ncbi:MAG: antibiotic biosynthesis monooxygenase [Sutterellaceae bacterium]|nr:antibiotic biosynthesis monooxygenase [Sutterellaceae bacterium]MDD7442370.1 hypothetical protein [Sutterellaceae bacterium]MDY2867124.1 hypothetical protein [Mesosutterella sp.]
MPAQTPNPPYYALNFTTIVSPGTNEIFTKLIDFVKETAPKAEGFLGIEEAKGEKEWITVTYWTSREAIDSWAKGVKMFAAKHPTVMMAAVSAKARIAKVEKALP